MERVYVMMLTSLRVTCLRRVARYVPQMRFSSSQLSLGSASSCVTDGLCSKSVLIARRNPFGHARHAIYSQRSCHDILIADFDPWSSRYRNFAVPQSMYHVRGVTLPRHVMKALRHVAWSRKTDSRSRRKGMGAGWQIHFLIRTYHH